MTKQNEVHVLRTLKEWLTCPLTTDEKVAKGKALSEVLENIRSEESRAEMVKASLKSALAALESKRDELCVIVSRGAEVREIEVEERADAKSLRVYKVRMDTGEITHERPMTPEERQQQLALTEATR
jgi:hypothetical protein